MAFFPYNCKACGKPGMIEVPDEDLEACGEFRPIIEGWTRLMAHDRCGDMMNGRRRIHEGVLSVFRWMDRCRRNPKNDVQEITEQGRRKLVSLTQRLCAMLCKHYRVIYEWEPFIADQLMAKPDGAIAILKSVEWGIRRRVNPIAPTVVAAIPPQT